MKTLYEFEVAICHNDKTEDMFHCSGYMASYKDALIRATEMADAIAPEKTIISITKKEDLK